MRQWMSVTPLGGDGGHGPLNLRNGIFAGTSVRLSTGAIMCPDGRKSAQARKGKLQPEVKDSSQNAAEVGLKTQKDS